MATFKVAANSCNSSTLATLLLLVALILHLPARTMSLQVATNVLLQGQAMFRGTQLVQPPYKFILQRDCNLVLYNDNNPLWASNTPDTIFEDCYFLLQWDGNGVLRNSYQEPIWATDTWGRNDGSHTITLQSDGNLVMTNEKGEAIWATNTAGR